MRTLAAVLLSVLCLSVVRADHHTISADQACHDQIQGRIPWDHSGNRRWSEENIFALCAGSRNYLEPGACFAQVMHGGVDWGGGRRWNWENAIALCRGSNDAAWSVGCFRQSLKHRLNWEEAISHCAAMSSEYERYPAYGLGDRLQGKVRRRASCQELVQGRIPWNDQGDTVWADRYLNRLCNGTRNPPEPGRCYAELMHGNVNWGGGTRWEPDNALKLCAGSSDAERTIACFSDAVYRGERWDFAIAHCSL